MQPHKVALIFATEPVFACISAWLFLNETLGWLGFIGAGLIIVGMLISELGDKNHPAKIETLDHTSAAP
jgi:drug/metabolite transporter (DMT)-like permease